MAKNSNQSKVFVVCDDPVACESLGLLIESFCCLNVEVYDSPSAFLESYEHSSPGCLVADIRRPEGGLALPVWLRSEGATIPVIFIFRHGDVAMAVQAGQAGAFDLIEKPFSDELLLDRIQKALEHDRKTRQDER